MSEIIPVLNAPDGAGGVVTIETSVRLALNQAAFHAASGGSDPKYRDQIVDQLMANVDAYAEERLQRHMGQQREKAAHLAKIRARQPWWRRWRDPVRWR